MPFSKKKKDYAAIFPKRHFKNIKVVHKSGELKLKLLLGEHQQFTFIL